MGRLGTGPRFGLDPATATARSNGRLQSVTVLGRSAILFRDGEEGYRGFSGARLAPAPALSVEGLVDVLDATLPADGGAMLTGRLVLGARTPPSQVPTAQTGHFRGTAMVVTHQPADRGGAADYQGEAQIEVRYGGGAATVTLAALHPANGPDDGDDLAAIEWTGLKLCAGRLVSTGGGRLVLRDGSGRAIDMLGGGVQALLDARLHDQGPDGAPAAVGGAFLLTGDAAAVTGVFAAAAAPPQVP